MVILGIHDGHCSSAALIVDGKLKSVISEERIVRRKLECCFPINAVNECLKIANLTIADIDKVAYSTFQIKPTMYLTKREASFSINDWLKEQNEYWFAKFYSKKKVSYLKIFSDHVRREHFPYEKKYIKSEDDFKGMLKTRLEHAKKFFKKDKIYVFDHQECHAYHALSFDRKKNEKKLIFSIDGGGDGANAACWILDPKKNNLITVARTNKFHIGRLYRYITLMLGMLPVHHEYKVMGLAPYANKNYAKKIIEIFLDTLDVKGVNFSSKKKIKDLYFYFKNKLESHRFDAIACGIQAYTEILITKWVKNIIQKYKINNICISGGVAQNIKANLELLNLKSVKTLLVSPGSGDEGLAIGSAFYCYLKNKKSYRETNVVADNAYLGNEYTNEEIKKLIKKLKLRKKFIVKFIDCKGIANLLSKGEILGIFSGKMEFGPRALGNRSIIADPRNFNIVKEINDMIKKRDFWMPFAPSIISERASRYLINKKEIVSKYMTIGYHTKDLAKKHLAAAIHPYDGTVRPHIVEKKDNENYYKIIKAFEKKTGVSAVLNTSFNLHGEPIVCSPVDAINTFKKSGLKNLVLGSYLLKKKK